MSPASIVLIGPYLSGKSTIRRLLAENLGLPQCSLNPFENDDLIYRYVCEGGYNEDEEARIVAAGGMEAADRYFKQFEVYALERGLAEHPGHIVEIGGTLSVYDDPTLFARARQALADCANVILLVPSADREASYHELHERFLGWLNLDELARLVAHPAFPTLAKHTVYSAGKTPEEVRDEVIGIITRDGEPQTPIILIGPPIAGKSTISNMLNYALRIPQIGLDVVGFDYATKAGFDPEMLQRLREQEGDAAAHRREQEIWCEATLRVVAEHPGHIVDFGAGHALYDYPDLMERFKAGLAPYPNVILLTPSPDPAEALEILKHRPRSSIGGMDANRYLILHNSNYDLATHVVYTSGKTPEQTRDEILARLNQPALTAAV